MALCEVSKYKPKAQPILFGVDLEDVVKVEEVSHI
jgi:hypothetical protein